MESLQSPVHLRQKLRVLEIKVSDLASMLNISRPTLYKAIEDYENDNKHKLSDIYIAIFDYIQVTKSKNAALSFIMQHVQHMPDKQSKLSDNDKTKQKFITLLANNSPIDSILPYLIMCHEILGKDTLSSQDTIKLRPLIDMYANLGLENIINITKN